jgi:molybdopterin-guanine dinucleotide biosynthesis protein A
MAGAGLTTFVVAKPDTELPPLEAEPREGSAQPNPGAGRALEIVREPAQPSHPLLGIVAALRHAGRPVVVLACDMPFASPALLAALAGSGADRLAGEDEALVVPAPGGEAEPLQARWSPTLLPALEAALAREEPLRRTVAALSPRLIGEEELARFGDPKRMFLNVNNFDDLRRTAAILER